MIENEWIAVDSWQPIRPTQMPMNWWYNSEIKSQLNWMQYAADVTVSSINANSASHAQLTVPYYFDNIECG